MKYIIRAIKYFFYFAFLTTALITILVLIGAVEGNIEAIFDGGYTALWKMAAFFAVVAAVYPSLAFIQREIPVKGDFSAQKNEIKEYMADHRYVLESETENTLTFRVRGVAGKLAKMYEDRITVTSALGSLKIDGLRKEVFRIAAGLDVRLNREETQQED